MTSEARVLATRGSDGTPAIMLFCEEVPSATVRVLTHRRSELEKKYKFGKKHKRVSVMRTPGVVCRICRAATRKRRFLLPQPTPFPDGQTDFVRYRRPSFSPWFHFCFSGELVVIRVTYLSTSWSILFVLLRCRPSYSNSRKSRLPNSFDHIENIFLV